MNTHIPTDCRSEKKGTIIPNEENDRYQGREEGKQHLPVPCPQQAYQTARAKNKPWRYEVECSKATEMQEVGDDDDGCKSSKRESTTRWKRERDKR
jgi:hypothetical protein